MLNTSGDSTEDQDGDSRYYQGFINSFLTRTVHVVDVNVLSANTPNI